MTKLTAAPNYIRELGILHGSRMCLEAMTGIASSEQRAPRRYRMPKYGCDVHLRPTRADHAIFFQCLVKCQYDVSSFPQSIALDAFYQKQLSEGIIPLILDCGGNVGLATLWLARRYPAARVIVIEPDDNNLALLELNIAAVRERVIVVKGGVWHRSAKLKIINPNAGSAAFRLEEDSAAGSIQGYGIHELCEIGGNAAPMFVKVDIEGAQSYLFSENTDWLRRVGLLSLELDDWLFPWAGTSRSFFKAIAPLNFDYLLGGESIFCFNADVLQSR